MRKLQRQHLRAIDFHLGAFHRGRGIEVRIEPEERIAVEAADRVGARQRGGRIADRELLARALLHETDHLNGKLYISHISGLKRDLMKRKIRKLQKAGEWK